MSGRWIGILLAASVALNLFLIGLMGGAWLKGGREDGREGRMGAMLMKVLPESRHDDIRALTEMRRAERRDSRSNRREIYREMREAMRAEPFDRASFEAAQARIIEQRVAGHDARDSRMADFMASLSHAERIAVVEAFEARWANRKRDETR